MTKHDKAERLALLILAALDRLGGRGEVSITLRGDERDLQIVRLTERANPTDSAVGERL